MKHLQLADMCRAAQQSGLFGCEMIALGRLILVFVQEWRFTEEHVCVMGQRGNPRGILRAIQRVYNVGEFLPAGFFHQGTADLPKAEISAAFLPVFFPFRADKKSIRLIPTKRAFQFGQPRTGRYAEAV